MTRPLADATWPQVEARPRQVLLVPVGSLEQHGPHLPLDTDTRIAAAVAHHAHESRPQTGLAPAIAYGASGEHAGFPGTVSIGTRALALLVVELVRDASRDWAGILVVNGHGGNADALRQAAQVCAQEGRRLVVHHLHTPGGDAHAGRTETSLMLHLAPSAVRHDLAEAGATDPLPALMPRLRAEGVRAVSPNGVLGDPAGATATEGARLFQGLTRSLLDRIDDEIR
ncbi:creatinine amidohydrolase [Thermomonospora echinospora]|uniref:Creatinine amidohydrolase n=1 Tax=Thermomonospora echinospora TaxID=1992 RepID=A0A1H6C2C3_9ACTN|nr:mycofactocin biosynthesis peptidyl-dipeptidase MftE [Thermomonospora echinospora]SEG67160.1 creatinine amidohydrolase [Thermomonospora echinospora]